MRPPVTVTVHGEVAPADVHAWLSQAHALVLPTRGENFGFAILEAFAAGRPVLVSPETPWRDLAARRAGWDVPLDDPDAWSDVITGIVAMDATAYTAWSAGARAVADAHARSDDAPARLEAALREAAGVPA
ncbi:MAG: glycosyltransferase [Vicinamibacterales bacterium]